MSSCNSNNQEVKLTDVKNSETHKAIDSHTGMIKILDSINKNSSPLNYYHWNLKQAELLNANARKGSIQEQFDNWFQYCQQLLLGGKTDACILQLEGYLSQKGSSYKDILNDKTLPMIDLLAIAYFRKGEQENCCSNHSSNSCILPIINNGKHQNKIGSEKAIELYSLLYNFNSSEKYKWLINLGYMTLGQYPSNVPEEYLIKIPKLKQNSDVLFKNKALEKGIAVIGLSGGTCIEDFNNDGYLDVFVTSYNMYDNCKLFINNKEGSFNNYTKESGLNGILGGLNTLHADYNNDGNVDVLVLRGGWLGRFGTHPNSLLQNNGDGTFTDVTIRSGLLSFHPTQTASWGDFNNDGFLDLFIGNESGESSSHSCELYQNMKDGSFKEVAVSKGLGNINAFIKGVTWGDINNDGWQDLFISVLGGKNFLFKNNQSYFTDISQAALVENPIFSFPCWFWDVNNDGFEDLFVGSYDVRNHTNVAADYSMELQKIETKSEKSHLYINNGDETFIEVSDKYNVSKPMYCMGSNFGDFNNDGFLDFYIGTGAPDYTSVVPNRLFQNVGGDTFEEVTYQSGTGHLQKGHGVSFADIDRDGDQDIYAVMGGAYEGDVFQNAYFENQGNNSNWLIIKVKGNRNCNTIGARIKVVLDDGRELFRTIGSSSSFGSNPLEIQLGLGKSESVKELMITFSNGTKEIFENIKCNQFLKVENSTLIPFIKKDI